MLPDNNVADEQYNQFIEQVIANRSVWALRSAEGYAVSPSNDYDDAEVIPFWSDAATAESLANDEWSDYKAEQIALGEFLETWMLGMQQEGMLVGTNWDASLEGTELEPLELAYALTGRLLETGATVELENFSLADFHEQLRQALDSDNDEEEADEEKA
ncbi:DUF2750 domain-containing protein [Flaviaesturariibacter flavus]|uniref:DUF2750 domain-containing protein n=1 Tax=Flaviaesturariibacter flavus TaxID=2502780 RepID=A0A4R1BN44_9BACT|nr:DUF2750 domain-containing protein [Flaviaesturariibacter flavus]TCJ18767.1 DUF2750 domain-containing protein [Flaviaesturariibacter flavus]